MQFRPIEKWPRKLTTHRKSSPFRSSYKQTIDLLETELEHLGARSIALQIALRPEDIRLDGLPRANAKPASHPGVILSFEKWMPSGKTNERGQSLGTYQPFSMPCDAFTDWESNLRAIALSLEALRKVDRYGVTQSGEQYTGWAALPAAGGDDPVFEAACFIAKYSENSATEIAGLKAVFQIAYRAAAKKLHPDAGGDTAQFQNLQQAADILRKHHGL